MNDKLHMPVFVTGVERSGISLVAKIISKCGGFTGKVTDMYENYQIKQLVDGYYVSLGIRSNGQYPLPDTQQMLIPSNWKRLVDEALLGEGYKNTDVWLYKSSRISQLWPIWNFAYPNARWIIVRRRTGDIIQSCLKTAYMNAFEDEKVQKLISVDNVHDGWLWWVREHEKRFVQMIENGLNCKVIWPERMADGDFLQMNEMLDWLGLEWNSEIVNIVNLLWSDNRKTKGVRYGSKNNRSRSVANTR